MCQYDTCDTAVEPPVKGFCQTREVDVLGENQAEEGLLFWWPAHGRQVGTVGSQAASLATSWMLPACFPASCRHLSLGIASTFPLRNPVFCFHVDGTPMSSLWSQGSWVDGWFEGPTSLPAQWQKRSYWPGETWRASVDRWKAGFLNTALLSCQLVTTRT